MTQVSPKGWGSDSLTEYLEAYRANQFATFANKDAAVKDLIEIDGMFALFSGAKNPRPLYPMGFMLRAHSAYRSGAGAVMAGQLFESHALLRLCLEHAAYGFYIGANKDRMERWLRRGESEGNRKAVKKEFHNDQIRDQLELAAPVMRQQFDYLYKEFIEFGAHPNEQGYSQNTSITRGAAGEIGIDTIYLQGDGRPLDRGLKIAGQTGLWSLHLMQLIYPERFELLGIRAQIEEVRTRF